MIKSNKRPTKVKSNSQLLFKLNSILIHSICYLMIIAAALNDGFAKFWIGIPYLIFLVLEMQYIETKLKYLNIGVITIAVGLFLIDRSGFTPFYPAINSNLTIEKTTVLYHDMHAPFMMVTFLPNQAPGDEKINYVVEKGSKLKIIRQYSSSAELSTNYLYGVKFDNENINSLFVNRAKSLKGRLETNSAYSKIEKKMPYLSIIEIRDITGKYPAQSHLQYFDIAILNFYGISLLLFFFLAYLHYQKLKGQKINWRKDDVIDSLKDSFLE